MTRFNHQNLIEVACKTFGVRKQELYGHRKYRKMARPRFVIATILRDYQGMTFKDIALLLRRQDHTTIINAVRRGRELYNNDIAFREKFYSIVSDAGVASQSRRVVGNG